LVGGGGELMDVTKDRRAKAIKPVATREEVYVFAHVAIEVTLRWELQSARINKLFSSAG
jgi:hypothetical protein